MEKYDFDLEVSGKTTHLKIKISAASREDAVRLLVFLENYLDFVDEMDDKQSITDSLLPKDDEL